MGKSPDAFRTISEAAGELDLPQHVLRFWETRFAQIKPLKRGGGRRYYRPGDVFLLKGIRHLLYDQGFTIKGVQRILREEGAGYAIAIGEAGSMEALELGGAVATTSPVGRQNETPQGDEGETGIITLAQDPPDQPGVKISPQAGISLQGRQKLTEIMRQLLECKRLLDNARKG